MVIRFLHFEYAASTLVLWKYRNIWTWHIRTFLFITKLSAISLWGKSIFSHVWYFPNSCSRVNIEVSVPNLQEIQIWLRHLKLNITFMMFCLCNVLPICHMSPNEISSLNQDIFWRLGPNSTKIVAGTRYVHTNSLKNIPSKSYNYWLKCYISFKWFVLRKQ